MNIFGFGRKDIKTSIGTLKFNIPSSPLECQTTAILISPDLVLATASSVYSSSRQCFYTNVRFATQADRKKEILVKNIRYHPNYLGRPSIQNDYALLKLAQESMSKDYCHLGHYSPSQKLILQFAQSKNEQIIAVEKQWNTLNKNPSNLIGEGEIQPGSTGGALLGKNIESSVQIVVGILRGSLRNGKRKLLIARLITTDLLQNIKIWEKQMFQFRSILSIIVDGGKKLDVINVKQSETQTDKTDDFERKYNQICKDIDDNEEQMCWIRVDKQKQKQKSISKREQEMHKISDHYQRIYFAYQDYQNNKQPQKLALQIGNILRHQ